MPRNSLDMDNRSIAKHFDLIAKLMELHGQNPFKIRTYSNAYQVIGRNDNPLIDFDLASLTALPGIGKTLAHHIVELKESGTTRVLDDLIAITPAGILDILKIKGIGAKKVAQIWKELGVESLGELEYACLENRLVSLKGFGEKTQMDLLKQIEFLKKSKGMVLLPTGIALGEIAIGQFREAFPEARFEITGELIRKMEVISQLEFIGTVPQQAIEEKLHGNESFRVSENQLFFANLPLLYQYSTEEDFAQNLLKTTLPPGLSDSRANDIRHLPAECLDLLMIQDYELPDADDLVSETDIRGVIHAHSKWSDGSHPIEDMALACMKHGYQYLVISDHSVSAFYANGLNEDRVLLQWKEIDEINKRYPDFKVFKGIESDILTDGRLDYSDEMLSKFEVVIASVHSVLKMDESAAVARLIKAIEHPATRILGHLTGRLLLSRSGYPVDHKKIIDACAANKVAIEINSNPHRLDIDWRWLPYAGRKGVDICLSPDAHHPAGVQDMIYGVWMGRKGGLVKETCINTKDRECFEKWLSSK